MRVEQVVQSSTNTDKKRTRLQEIIKFQINNNEPHTHKKCIVWCTVQKICIKYWEMLAEVLLMSAVGTGLIMRKLHRFFIPCGATRCGSWLRHCATSPKVAGSIPDGIIGNFFWGPSSPLCWFNSKEFLCITHTVEHNYISPSITLGLQLRVSALYVGHLQVVTWLSEQLYKMYGVLF